MVREDIIMLSQRELKILHVVKKVIEGLIKQNKAAKMLLISIRQVRRIMRRIKREGDKGIVHRSRGKACGRKISSEVKNKVISLYRGKYQGFGPTLMMEKLEEAEGIKISDETIRLWLIESGDREKERKGRKHREWRARRESLGEMVQMDGSHHNWFEGRGGKCVLMGYIDDATGKVFGKFYGYEGTIPAMDSFKGYIQRYGIPMSIYLDRHTTYKSTAKPTIEDELNGRKALSEFERAMKEMGVEVKHAYSPQAKGRIERLFNTMQDRLVKEMRLKGISTLEEANKFLEGYLPVYNKKFEVKAKTDKDFHREIGKGMKIEEILCIKTERTVKNDFTISYNSRLYQILDKTNRRKVIVEEHIDGSMVVTNNGVALRFKEITDKPEKIVERESILKFTEKKYTGHIPPKDHPWRKFSFNKNKESNDYQAEKLS